MTSVVVYPHAATVFAAVCACIFIVVGVLGNLITIVALLRNSKLRSHATTAFVLSLCASDLLFCLISLPLTASRYVHKAWTFGDTLCKLFPVIFYSNVAVSLLSMVGITVNRFILIAFQKHYARMYRRWSIAFQLLLVWIFSIGIMIPPLLGKWGKLGFQESTFSCTILPKDGSSIKKFIFVVGFLIPCVVIITSYSCIYSIVRKQRQKLNKHNTVTRKTNGSCRIRDREDSRLTAMMLIIFICFLVCFFPLMLVNVIMEDDDYPWLQILASILAWASSVINPFIYAASNRTYRVAYYKLLSTLKFWGQPLSPMPSKTFIPSKGSRDGSQNNNSGSLNTTKEKVHTLDIKNGTSGMAV
ncbi:hypothetical protein HA402_015290 [Bradysia odoriphaga]|nr:hypothetical protein HA402_015290 [Bradysia odoriphaga]